MENNKIQIAFAATDKEWSTTIPSFKEGEARGKSFITYGEDNLIPEYLHSLYDTVSSLRTIINGTTDFVIGDDIECNIEGFNFEVNRKGDTIRELATLLVRDYLIYGGYAIQVIRNLAGKVSELYYIDFRYLRSDKNNDLFWYSEEYDKRYVRSSKTLVYPKFIPEAISVPSSIVYVKNEKSQTYPSPCYKAALKDCEIERQIDEYHLAALENGFGGSYVMNFNGGIPDDEQKAEIEENINEKFAGASNAGRILLNFCNSKDNALTLEKLEIQDFSEKYQAAATRSREQIYCAFQAVPALFGLMSESTGFNEQEFQQSFRLYNRTKVKSIQRMVCDSFDKIFQVKGSITITPFSIEENGEKEEEVE